MMIDTILFEQSPGELRAAMLAGGVVWQVDHHRAATPVREGAIYLGRVRRLDPGANAAFVSLGDGPDGFLRARDVVRPGDAPAKRARINQLVQEGAAIVVQITADTPGGGKGPTVSGPGAARRPAARLPAGHGIADIARRCRRAGARTP